MTAFRVYAPFTVEDGTDVAYENGHAVIRTPFHARPLQRRRYPEHECDPPEQAPWVLWLCDVHVYGPVTFEDRQAPWTPPPVVVYDG